MLAGKFVIGVNIFAIVVPLVLFFFGITFIWPSIFAGAFEPFGKVAGYAGALYSFMQIGGGAVVGAIVAHIPDTDQVPLALVFVTCTALAWLVFERVVNKA